MLLHLRIVGRAHIRFVHVFYELVGILGSPKLLERRVGMERGPVLFPYLPAEMSHKIDAHPKPFLACSIVRFLTGPQDVPAQTGRIVALSINLALLLRSRVVKILQLGVAFMKLYAALVFSFCMGLHGNSQTTNKADVDARTQRIADPSCDTAASSRPGLSQDQFVKAIIDQTVCRGKFVTPEGIHGMTFVPISNSDHAAVIALGVNSIAALTKVADTTIADTGDNFAQLIAVRLLADVGGPDAAPPLERALEPKVWQPTRMAALYGISKQGPELADPILQRMKLDADPKISEIATSLLQESHQ
jgi:hypothetical protein